MAKPYSYPSDKGTIMEISHPMRKFCPRFDIDVTDTKPLTSGIGGKADMVFGLAEVSF